jgi:hypothetical protein
MVVLVEGPDGVLVAVRPTPAQRVRARLVAGRSDRRLAWGTPPERDLCLALRAERLVRTDTRRGLARSLLRLLEDARRPPRRSTVLLSPQGRHRLVESRAAVTQVVEDLRRPAPLSSHGVAALCVLLRDGSGPLYGPGSGPELRDRLTQVHRQLVSSSMWSG